MAYMRSAYLGYQYAWKDDQCFVVRLEDICFDARNTVAAIYDFVGLDFKRVSASEVNVSITRLDRRSVSSMHSSLRTFLQNSERICCDFEFDRWFFPF